ncbi:MAG: hypothetical protein R2771_00285 [Saprospiraceae bacterium]
MKYNKYKFILIFVFILNLNFTENLFSQNKISIDEAISIVLKNNYDIIFAQNDNQIAIANNTKEMQVCCLQ